MTRVQVTRGDDTFTGLVEAVDTVKVAGSDHPQERLTVHRDDTGARTYVLPQAATTTVMKLNEAPAAPAPPPVAPGLDHLAPSQWDVPAVAPSDGSQVVGSAPAVVTEPALGAPAPRVSQAPPAGVMINGVPMAAPAVPVPAPAVPMAVGQAEVARPVSHSNTPVPRPGGRFIISATGKPQKFHTRLDCSKVAEGAKTLPVDDAQVEFFGLTHCSLCAKRDKQISWQDVIEQVAPQQAGAIIKALTDKGFSVSPDVVDV